MSQDFMDPEIFADFIVEAKEHLETIEPNLLELEQTPGNLELLNKIFRPMHSLKGASGFLGLNKINRLAHKAENILDELRKGAMSVTPEIMDIILTSTDALRQMLDSLDRDSTEGDTDIVPIIAILDAIMSGEIPASAASPAVSPDTVALKNDLAPATLPEPIPDNLSAPAPENLPEPAPLADTVSETLPEITAPLPAPEDDENQRLFASIPEWIASRPKGEPYPLTAFGEGHLKDFIEEARENIASINAGLLELEKHPNQESMINDLFRFFHNIKGNSGIIGFQEMNQVTHEAETLLNSVRHGEKDASRELIDLLLFVSDVLEAQVSSINPAEGTVTPFEIAELLGKLTQAVAGGPIELPDSLTGILDSQPPAPNSAPVENSEDLAIFIETIAQQKSGIAFMLKALREDGTSKDIVDGLYRSLVCVQNSNSFMGFEEIKVYAQRTAGIVDQGRSRSMDFSLMVDLLDQECEIIFDMIAAKIGDRGSSPAHTPTEPETAGKAPVAEENAQDPVNNEAAQKTAPEPAPEQAVPAPVLAPDAAPVASVPAKPVTPETPVAPVAATSADSNPAPAAATVASLAAPVAAKPATPEAASAQSASGGDSAPAKTSSTIRVDHEKLDRLMELIGELIINRNRYSLIAKHLENSDGQNVVRIAQDISETTYAMARISDDLQDMIMKVRMVPVASVFSRFPRLVRDLSRKSGKEVDLIMEGEDTELDKSVVEVIGDPLVHLIRNAMDHGIEEETLRRAAGKPPKGKVWLRAYHKGNSVAIEIEDDGKGIDPEKMREVAIRKGIISAEEAKALDDREARELIFAPGFSSTEVITDISGRGVGMDVVRTNIKSLKGTVSISSEVGKGTKFTLSLPLTLAIIDALLVTVDDSTFAIPLDAVSETAKIEAHRLTDVRGRKAVTLRGEVLGIISLAEMLGMPTHMDQQSMLSVVIIHDNDRRLGLVVDGLLERQEVVIKPLSSYLGDLKGISGATIMGDGSVILILDPHEIYMMATSKAL